MKQKPLVLLLIFIVSFGMIYGCIADTRQQSENSELATSTITPFPEQTDEVSSHTNWVTTPYTPFLPELTDHECFEPLKLMPKEITKENLLAAYGEPDSTSTEGSWFYASSTSSMGMSIIFDQENVAGAWLPTSNCVVSDLIELMGTPEIVEIVVQTNEPGPPVYPTKTLHYPSQGIAFVVPCTSSTSESCHLFNISESIETIKLYRPSTVQEIIESNKSEFVEWTGFNP